MGQSSGILQTVARRESLHTFGILIILIISFNNSIGSSIPKLNQHNTKCNPVKKIIIFISWDIYKLPWIFIKIKKIIIILIKKI